MNGYVENNYIDYETKGNKMGNYDNLSQTSMSDKSQQFWWQWHWP